MCDQTRHRIVALAHAMLAGNVDLVTGAYEMCRLRIQLPEAALYDEDLLTFVVVASELDGMPRGTARELWEVKALEAKDRQRDEYLASMHHVIEQSCRNLIARFS